MTSIANFKLGLLAIALSETHQTNILPYFNQSYASLSRDSSFRNDGVWIILPLKKQNEIVGGAPWPQEALLAQLSLISHSFYFLLSKWQRWWCLDNSSVEKGSTWTLHTLHSRAVKCSTFSTSWREIHFFFKERTPYNYFLNIFKMKYTAVKAIGLILFC